MLSWISSSLIAPPSSSEVTGTRRFSQRSRGGAGGEQEMAARGGVVQLGRIDRYGSMWVMIRSQRRLRAWSAAHITAARELADSFTPTTMRR